MTKFKLKHEIGKNLKKMRNEKAWNQGNVAKLLGISIPAYSKIEASITDVNISRIEQLAEVFGVSINEVLFVEAERPELLKSYEIEKLNLIVEEKNGEIVRLQDKVIRLYEEFGG